MTRRHHVEAQCRRELADAGLDGSFLVRDLDTGAEIGLNAETAMPIASLVKIPLVMTVLCQIDAELLAGDERRDVSPGRSPLVGPTGVTKFRHGASIAVDDLLYLALSVSDSSAADALFELVGIDDVRAHLAELGLKGFGLRHRLGELMDTPQELLGAEHAPLAHAVTIGVDRDAMAVGGVAVERTDPARANTASARSCVELLSRIWTPGHLPEPVAARMRELMADNVLRHRLAPDFVSDDARWASKTGTLLNLRHEIGVITHADGGEFAVAALTRSTVPAVNQPAAEAVMGRVARRLHDYVRDA